MSLVWDTLCIAVLGIGLAVFGIGEQICRLATRMAELEKENP
jgi:hypothetical protein